MGPPAGGKGREGHHLAHAVPHIEFFQILRQHAVGGIRLGVDLFDPTGLDEVVDIGAAEGRRNGVVNGTDGNPQGAGLVPIHVDVVFGHIFHAVGPDSDQSWVLRRHAEKLVAGRHEFFVTQAATVLQLKIKPGGNAQFDHRRRREGEHHGAF